MILGINRVLELIKEKNLIEGLDEDNQNFEGCGVDVRIGDIYEMEEGDGFLHKETRKSPNFKLLAKFDENKPTKIRLEPGKTYSAKTIEKINTPKDLMGWFIPRGTLYKCGIVVQGIRTDPGYCGNFTFIMTNNSKNDFEVELGARIACMVFHRIDGRTNKYKGQWQGGRAFIAEEEKQIITKEKI